MMKRHLMMAIGCSAIGLSAMAQSKATQERDSMKMVEMQKIEIISTRASSKTPVTYTNVDKKQLARINYGQDMPFLLMMTPSVVATSDAGAGVGYTGIRIRGTDATRISITTNGIPMNDPESHSLFWVNTPDLVSSIEDLQIQRGAGTSTNGAGAFGGSINMRTEALTTKPAVELNGTYGSFNTHKEMIKVNSGLIDNRWAFSARLSNIKSDGYVDRASSDLKSYFAQGGYYGKSTVVKFITFGGTEKTYHAWTGISADSLKTNRRYNPCGAIENANGDVIDFYDNQTDNYNQQNYQLLVSQKLTDALSLNVNFHYTYGDGYYEDYKNRRTLKEYGLAPFETPEGTVKKSDLVRRKHMLSDFGGAVFSLDYKREKFDMSLGGAVNKNFSDHFGRVAWVKNYVGNLATDHEYYDNDSEKFDANIYLKGNYEVARGVNIYADMQYRHISHTIEGQNDNWDWINGVMQAIDVDRKFDFFNPKVGMFYQVSPSSNLYASFAVAQKEPTRNNYTDAKTDARPSAERMYDYEMGYKFSSKRFAAGVNLYYMKYRNQFILTGETNEIGEPLADNVPDSYRMGVELTAGVEIAKWLRWDVNLTLSENKIQDHAEYVYHLDESGDPTGEVTKNTLGSTTISFSPSVIAGSLISASYRGWNAALMSNFVGEQYLSNSEQKDLMLDSYFINNLNLGYTFKMRGVSSLSLGVSINNLFNVMYVSNGGAGSNYLHNGERSNYAWYFPQAGTNVLANIAIRF